MRRLAKAELVVAVFLATMGLNVGVASAGINVWTSNGPVGAINSLAIDPITSETVYAGLILDGVYKTLDGGSSWAQTALTSSSIWALAIDPLTPATVYAGSDGGVFRSFDGGGSWTAAKQLCTFCPVYAFAIDPITPATLYAGTYGGVFKSIDGGGSWTPAGLTAVNWLAIDPTMPATVYAGTQLGIFKSVDGGGSWTPANSGLTDTFVWVLVIDPATPTTLYAGTGLGMFKSADGGGSWTAVNAGLPRSAVEGLAIDPITPATVYAGAFGGGVFKSVDSGKNWTAFNNGLTNNYVDALAIDRTGKRLHAGTSSGFGGVYDYTVASASSFYTLTPCRLADTRNPVGPYGGPALAANADRTFVIAGQCGIPPTATAVSFNFTVTQPTAQGDLRAVEAGVGLPLVSTLNWRPGQTRANNAIVPLGVSGGLLVHAAQANGTVHFIIDANGYFQ